MNSKEEMILKNEFVVSHDDAMAAFMNLREQTMAPDYKEMSLEEINEEIAKSREINNLLYSPEFVAKMMEAKKQIDEGRVVIKTMEELRAMEV